MANLVAITYTLWIGSAVMQTYFLELNVVPNSTFFSVMQQAADTDSTFKFEATSDTEFGNYITTIAGQSEDVGNNTHWMLYRLGELPNRENPPADEKLSPVGVDNLLVQEGDNFLFWLRNFQFPPDAK